MMDKDHYDVLVIGAGVLGIFAAYHALARGLRVALMEKDRQPQGASVRNFGQIVPSGLSQQWRKHGINTLEIFDDLAKTGHFSIYKHGSTYISNRKGETQLLYERHELDHHDGYNSEMLSARQVLDLYPCLRSEYTMAGLRYEREYSVSPYAFMNELLAYMQEQLGLQFFPGCLCNDIQPGPLRKLKASSTRGQMWLADRIVICCGVNYQLLFPEHYDGNEIKVCKLQMLQTARQTKYSIRGNLLTGRTIRRYECFEECPSFRSATVACEADKASALGIHILLKQMPTGEVILGDSHQYVDYDGDEAFDFRIDQQINDLIVRLSKEIIYLDTWRIANTWTGFYSQTALPEGILDFQNETGVYFVNAIGGKGMSAGPGYMKSFITKLFA